MDEQAMAREPLGSARNHVATLPPESRRAVNRLRLRPDRASGRRPAVS